MADNENKKTLSEKIKESRQNVVDKEFDSDIPNAVSWYKIVMAACIVMTGLLFLFGIIMNHLNEEKMVALNNQSVINSNGSRVLPAGDYYIYRVFLDPALRNHYVVASMKGGALVSVVPPDNTPEPENILAVSKYDSAAYVIRVDSSGAWSFLPTSVLKGILEKQNLIMDDATYRATYKIDENINKQTQNNVGNTGTAANNTRQGQ